MAAFHKIVYAVDGPVARLTLNRPEKRNALDSEMASELRRALAESAKNSEVRVVLLSGAGKDFCSGADLAALHQIANATVMENVADARQLADVFLDMRRHPRPIVAAVCLPAGLAFIGHGPEPLFPPPALRQLREQLVVPQRP